MEFGFFLMFGPHLRPQSLELCENVIGWNCLSECMEVEGHGRQVNTPSALDLATYMMNFPPENEVLLRKLWHSHGRGVANQ
jgi:hypothetical protein